MLRGPGGGVVDLLKVVDCQQASGAHGSAGHVASSSSFFAAAQCPGSDSELSDWFSGCFAGPCDADPHDAASRLSSLGEPATPNKVDGFLSAYSPQFGFAAGHRADQGPWRFASSSGHAALDDSILPTYERGSCEYAGCPDQLQRDHTAHARRSDPVPVLRGRFLSAPAVDAMADLGGGGRTAFINALLSQLAAADSRVSRLEHQLREQRAAGEALARQLQERNAQLLAARLERSQHVCNAAEQDTPPAQQPHRSASEHTVEATGVSADAAAPAAGVGCGGAGLPWGPLLVAPGTPATELLPQLAAAALPAVPWLEAGLLMRLDTPAVPHEGPAAAISRCSSSTEAAEPVRCGAAVAAGSSRATHDSAAAWAAGIHAAPDALAPVLVAAPAGDPHPHLPYRQSLAAQQLRTDAAHRALLVSSRQAQRLSDQVAALRVRTASLQEELLDWRGAALDNHKVIARLRRAAAAQGRQASGAA